MKKTISVDTTSAKISSGTGELMISLSMTGMGQSVRCTLNVK